MVRQRRMMGEMLVEMGIISPEQLTLSLSRQRETGGKLGKILVEEGVMSEAQLIETLESLLGVPRVQVSTLEIDPEAVKMVSPHILKQYTLLPVRKHGSTITVVMADPLDQQALDDVRMACGLDVIPLLASEEDLKIAIRQYLAFKLDSSMETLLTELGQYGRVNRPRQDIHLVKTDDAPIVKMVNAILNHAVQGRCSDIHIEPQENNTRVRFRLDGQLYQVLNLPQSSEMAIISRIKIMSGMDIAEKRLPQDGRFCIQVENREVDFRVSTLPAAYGEKVVLRILDRMTALTRLNQLGFTAGNMETLLSLVRRPSGMILLTGPTGSGKTSAMYSILAEINSMNKNITTLEDPVEYSLPGVNQVQINPRAGLNFATGLRSILRQDPDIIMVGEIRDEETARLAVQSSLTGHLILSTLHTRSAAGAIARLKDMGIQDFLISSAVSGVVAQRLVRSLCPNCREKYLMDAETARRLGSSELSGKEFYRPKGCNMCRQLGYTGRIALQEVMVIGTKTRQMIARGETDEEQIYAAALREGMISIKEDGISKARQGLTSLEEVMKVILLEGDIYGKE